MSGCRDQKATVAYVATTSERFVCVCLNDIIIRLSVFYVYGNYKWCVGTCNTREACCLCVSVLFTWLAYGSCVVDVVCAACTWFVCLWQVVRRQSWLPLQLGAPGSL
ncbi:hypothetical protein Taro_030006 [Colocasia esculenta]|uniref:Uncharacterized protein n=1 Tax=Colocasia esculenta TaxID=4460 RepID=A0A843VUW2_COLES|nr:hypothetical protein [Colocasia esculenta]